MMEALDAERKKNEELHARIDRLETDKKVLVQESPGAGLKADKLTAFKEKLRKMKKMMSDPALKDGNGVNPDQMVELTEVWMEFLKLSATRAKEPKAYAEYLQAFYEIGLEGEGTALTADQSAALTALLQGYGQDLSQVSPTPAGERLLKELQLEASTMGKVKTLLTESQRAAMSKENMDAFATGNMMSMSYVMSEGAADQIAQQWSSLYQLDSSQLPQAKLAAQSYVDAMARIGADLKGGDPSLTKPGSPEAYDYRLQSVRQQLAALSMLQASMTTAQQDRLLNQTMKEIHIINGQAQVTTTDK